MMANKLLWAFAWFWRIITLGYCWRMIKVGGDKYLLRLYLSPGWLGDRWYLHHFFAADTDRELHNHPWLKAESRILSGWYLEERLANDGHTVKKHIYRPGDQNMIRAEDFHRIAIVAPGTWTLFCPAERIQNWGFLDLKTRKYRDAEDQRA